MRYTMRTYEYHGMSKHPLYNIWTLMKGRCYSTYSTSYHNYGAKGITVCRDWLNSSKAFFDWALNNGYAKGLEIDRRDNLKGYSPDNCRFVTGRQNCLNRGARSNSKSKYRGVSCISGYWYAEIGGKHERIRKGGFKTDKDAAVFRDEQALKMYGEDAWTNKKTFPEDF